MGARAMKDSSTNIHGCLWGVAIGDALGAPFEGLRPGVNMALLSLQTGMRAGKIFNLRGQDLDFENNLISIMDSKNKQARKAYMTEGVRALLLTRIPENPTALVFPDQKGNTHPGNPFSHQSN
jgi:integrase